MNLEFWVRFGGFRNGVERDRTKAVFCIFVELKKPELETETGTEVLTFNVAWDKVLNSDPVTLSIPVGNQKLIRIFSNLLYA